MGLLAGANVVWAVLFFRGDDTFPSASDAIHLVSAVALVVGLSILSRDSGVDNDGLGGIEVAIVGIAVGLGDLARSRRAVSLRRRPRGR